ncbi:MAG TPA: ergothioneine biosynthesis protein EgtB [Acidimicrobiia bacterium]|nr:ergothioneine biosynthesis protein EgtB [Acidimicrobiia bacterium]
MTALTTGPALDASERVALHDRYRRVRDLTEALAAPLSDEDQVVQSMPDASPTKWHRAHTTWFFETFLLSPCVERYAQFDPAYAYLFNSYYEAVGPRHPRPQRGLLSRPSVGEIARYRAHVDDAMHELIDKSNADAAELIVLGLHHEQQHQELLLMDIKHVLHSNPTDPAYAESTHTPVAATPLHFAPVHGGNTEIGDDGPGFSFDNERPRHVVHLEPVGIANRLVCAHEYLEFIADDGYRRPELWLSDGWYAVQQNGWEAPLYWRDDGADGWSVFTLGGRRPLDANEPVVHVSHYEADAYARWRDARLPTEFEWEHAVACSPPDTLSEIDDVAWQWTSSAYLPYPRFRPPAGAVGEYNGKFMSGQMTLRGGARQTPLGHTRVTYRNFFPPSSRWMFGGVRLALDVTQAGS